MSASDQSIQLKRNLLKQLDACYFPDKFKLKRRIYGCDKIKDAEKRALALLEINDALTASIEKKAQRFANLPNIEYPDLPVSAKKDDIAKAIQSHQVVIVAGETGSGKTTQLPKICLELGRGVDGFIGHTQPRRLAARTVAQRIAQELQCQFGEQVGFKVRFTDQTNDDSYVKLMTDGILLAEIQQDPYLNQYDTLIIDEAHERSLNIDFILGYIKQLLPKRPELKVIITSATIDPERFSKHFNDAPIIEVSGRTYPVETRYRPLNENASGELVTDKDRTQGIIEAVEELSREGRGDILIFMNGEREIRDTADALEKCKFPGTHVLPLYARLASSEQNKIFQSHSGRRIVLATNVAETSLTVPGIKYVIDPGTARVSRYSHRLKIQRLPIEAVSQASANQRKGRCGRTSDGICIRLYSEDDFNNRPEFTDPEILRTNLASVILQMMALNFGDIQGFPFIQPPDTRSIRDGFLLLEEIGALAKPQGASKKHQGLHKLTKDGRSLSKIPVDPRYAKMVLASANAGCIYEVAIIVAGLSIQDPRERPLDFQQASDEKHNRFKDTESDFASLLNLWRYTEQQGRELSKSQFRKMCQKEFLNYLRIREWQDIVLQIRQAMHDLGFKVGTKVAEQVDYNNIHQSILAGLLSHLGFKDKEREYQGARNSKFMLFPGSGLFKKQPKWLMAAELVETSKLFGRMAAKIQPEWVEPLAKHLCKYSHSEPVWRKKRGTVTAQEKVTLYGLTLVAARSVNYSKIDPKESQQIFIRDALVTGELNRAPDFVKQNLAVIEEVEALEHKSRRRDILVDEQVLVEFYSEKLPSDVLCEVSLNKWWKANRKQLGNSLVFDKSLLMRHDAEQVTERLYPAYWLQNNMQLELEYHFEPNTEDDGVSVLIPLTQLNQLENSGFDWLVEGLREELITTLIKGLPKAQRKNFVPAPNYASACMQAMEISDKPFIQALSDQLRRMTGTAVDVEQWQQVELPAHLRFNFKVLDHQHQVLAQGRDLLALQQQLSGQVKQTLSQAAEPGIEQQALTEWSFGELPQEFVRKKGAFEIKAYPGLVDDKQSVAIQLFESAEQALQETRKGLRRLILLQIPSPVSYLKQKLPNKAKLGLYFNPWGQVDILINDCINAAIDVLIEQQGGELPRNESSFIALKELVRGELNEQVLAIAQKVEKTLTLAHQVNKQLKGKIDLSMIQAQGDIKAQLESLIFKGFVCELGADKLDDLHRYMQAIEKRLEKLKIDPSKDRRSLISIEKMNQLYAKLAASCKQQPQLKPALIELRWMIEEYRVSLFAQTLGTQYPISEKRIVNFVDSL